MATKCFMNIGCQQLLAGVREQVCLYKGQVCSRGLCLFGLGSVTCCVTVTVYPHPNSSDTLIVGNPQS